MKEPSVSKRCSLECDTVHEFPHPFQKKERVLHFRSNQVGPIGVRVVPVLGIGPRILRPVDGRHGRAVVPAVERKTGSMRAQNKRQRVRQQAKSTSRSGLHAPETKAAIRITRMTCLTEAHSWRHQPETKTFRRN